EVRPEYERNSPRMSSNSYVNLKIATCLVRYADDRLIDQRFPKNASVSTLSIDGHPIFVILQKPFFCRRELSHSFFTIPRLPLSAAQWPCRPTPYRMRVVLLMQL
ncbi:hypothetical protein QZN00_24925, partial [Burkholderia multivorans]|nr:hypothetical protein [Burkholderia multivorans]